MGKEFTKAKSEIRKMLKEAGMYDITQDPLIEIAAAQKVLHKRVIDDIEKQHSPVIRDYEEMDATPDEAVKLLPKVAKDYHNALVALGIAGSYIEDPKPGRPAKEAPLSDSDAVAELIQKAVGDV